HAMLRDSLQKLGAGRSILVDKHGKIIAGNKTAQEAFAAGLEDVVVVQTRGDKLVVVQREDLDLDADERARLLSIADNRASEVGLEWDTTLLAELVESDELDLSDLFYDEELEAIVGSVEGGGEPADDPGAQVDRAEELREKWQTERGQLWQIGRHRLL